MDYDLSIDKVSIVGRPSDTYDLQCWLDRKVDEAVRVPDADGVVSRAKELPQRRGASQGKPWVVRSWQIDGVNVQLRLKVPTEHRLSIERWDCLEGDESAYRLEWNPNKTDAGSLVLFMESPRPTRYDVAVDYPGVFLGDWTVSRPRVKSCSYVDASGNHNGIQLGGMKSDRFTVAYDKALELGLTGLQITRIEMRQRILPGKDPLHENLFDGLAVVRREIPSCVSPREAGMLALRLYEPAHFARLDADTKRKYDRMALEHCGQLAPSPGDVYRERRNDLREWAHMCLEGERPPVAQVYQECETARDAAPDRLS